MAQYNPNQYQYNTYVVGGQVVDPSKKGPRYPWSPTNTPYGPTPDPGTVTPTYPGGAPAPAPTPPPPPNTGGGDNTGGTGTGGTGDSSNQQRGDYSSDPILQQIISRQNTQDVPDINARLLEGQKQALLALGSRSLAEAYLGKNDPFVGTIDENPYTGLGQLAQIGAKYSYEPGLQGLGWQLREGLNKQNLFYGGARNLQETGLGRARLGEQFGAEMTTQQQMGSLKNTWLDAMMGIRRERSTAEADAYNRWLQNLINSGGTEEGGTDPTGEGAAPTTTGPFPGLAGTPETYGGYVPGSNTITDLSAPPGYTRDPVTGELRPIPQGYIPPPGQIGFQ